MMKSLSIAGLTVMIAIAMAGMAIANEPITGQSDVNITAQPGLFSENPAAGPTPGMGSASGSDVGIDNSLKAKTQAAPCAGQSSAQFGADMSAKPQQEANAKSSAAEAAQKAMSNVKKADSVDSDTLRNPEARSSAETRLEAGSTPCPENSGTMK
jgi:hypothetical protein